MAAAKNTRNALFLSDKLADIKAQSSYVRSILNLIEHCEEFSKLPGHHQCVIQAVSAISYRLDLSLEEFDDSLDSVLESRTNET